MLFARCVIPLLPLARRAITTRSYFFGFRNCLPDAGKGNSMCSYTSAISNSHATERRGKKRPLPAVAERGYPKNRYNLYRGGLLFALFLHIQRNGHFVSAAVELLETLKRNIVGVV